MNESEAKRIIDRQFESLNTFMSIKGMKKYAYAYGKRLNFENLVLNILSWDTNERRLYDMEKTTGQIMRYQLSNFSDKLIPVLDLAMKKYTFPNKKWNSGIKNRYPGYWAPHTNLSIENRDVANYRRDWTEEYPMTRYANYFFLNTWDSMVWYDNKDMKMRRVNLINGELPFIAFLEDKKDTVKLILGINNVDVRKNILKQIKFDYMKYVDPIDKKDNYELVGFVDSKGGIKRIYLKMINPSTAETHIEAVHPNCNTVQDAINYRRYGSTRPNASQIGLNSVLDWQPVQLS
jgi:hypothetical protein